MIEGQRILIVDDDPELRMLCGHILEQAGYLVDQVDDGESLLQQLEERAYQLVLLDWLLPGLGGRSLLEAVGWRWPDVPIVIMTGYSDEEKAVAAVEYAQAYLRKPFDRQQLLDTVSRVLHRTAAFRSGDYQRVARSVSYADGSAFAGPPDASGATAPDATGAPGAHAAAVQAFAPGARQAGARQAGAVEINPLRCEARMGDGPPVSLTATEYAVLNHLFVSAGQVVPHKALARLLSPRPLTGREAAALCKHHIRALRTKLEPDPTHPVYIQTVWGQGYRLIPNGIKPPQRS